MIRLDALALDAGPVSLRALDLVVPTGATGALLGPVGAGKSSLLECVAGVRAPRAGRVIIGDDDVTSWPPERRRAGVVFQRGWLFEHLDVRGNVAYGARDAATLDAAVRATGVDALYPRAVATLSGGERQRVALARALATGPRVLLLDEPWAAMDAALHAAMRDAVRAWQRAHGTTTLLVTHDPSDLGDDVVARLELPAPPHGAPRAA